MRLNVNRMGGALRALRATPVEAAVALGLATTCSLSIADRLGDQASLRLMLTGALAFVAVFAVSLAHALGLVGRLGRRVATGVVVALAVPYGTLILDPAHQTEVWRWAFLLVAALAAVLLVPAAAPIPSLGASDRFWRFGLRFGLRAIGALAYGGLLYTGLAIALFATKELFHVNVPRTLYGHLAAWIFLAVAPLLALDGLEEARRLEEPIPDRSMALLGMAGTFLFVPMVLLYLAILLAYLARIVVTREFPSNVLSPLTLGAGALGWFGHFALHPCLSQEGRRPLRWVLQFFPPAFLLPALVGLWSVLVRIDQHGWTEFRYARAAALLALVALGLVATLPALRRRASPLLTGPAILLALALAASLGPLSAAHVSQVSQLGRARAVAERMGLLGPDGRLLARADLERRGPAQSAADTNELYSALAYVIEAHGVAALASLTSTSLGGHSNPGDTLQALGLRRWWMSGVSAYATYHRSQNEAFTLAHGGRAQEFSLSRGAEGSVQGLLLRLDGPDLAATAGGREYRAHLSPRPVSSGRVESDWRSRALREDEVVRPLQDGQANELGEVILEWVSFESQDGTWRVSQARGILLLH